MHQKSLARSHRDDLETASLSNNAYEAPSAFRAADSNEIYASPENADSLFDTDQSSAFLSASLIGLQTKLTVSEQGDALEQEADRLAGEILKSPERALDTPNPPPIGNGGLHLKSDTGFSSPRNTQSPIGDQKPVDYVTRAGGLPLTDNTRGFFESRMGLDLSDVRVHHGPEASVAAKSIAARAFTLGSDIVFKEGEYNPDTQAGRQLLAHELVHVAQQQKVTTPTIIQRDNGESASEPQIIRAPAEFEVSSGMFISWGTTSGSDEDALANIILASYQSIQVYILARDEVDIATKLMDRGIDTSQIIFLRYTPDSIWIRDFAPIWAIDGAANMILVDPYYYEDRTLDDCVPDELAMVLGIPPEHINEMPVYMEGGNFMSNGDGVCVATSVVAEGEYQLRGDRLSTPEVSQYFFTNIGCDETIVLHPLEFPEIVFDQNGDAEEIWIWDGTGHVDMFAKFLNRDTVMLGEFQETNQSPLAEGFQQVMNAILNGNKDILEGAGFNVVRVPMVPLEPIDAGAFYADTDNIPELTIRTYTNSLIVNSAYGERFVLMPVYGDPVLDLEAELLYAEMMPDYTIIPIDSSDLILFGGAVHCVTALLPCQIDNCGAEMTVYFEYDEHKLSQNERDALSIRNYPVYIRANPSARIRILGHTDDVGSTEYNEELSMRRANSVRQYLEDIGIPSENIAEPVGLGEEAPRIPGTSEYARGHNRRVEISFD